MEFGLFVQGYVPGPNAHDPEHEHAALIREMELVQTADRYGWKFAWLTEHHGLTEYSHLSSNEVHAGYLAACTDRIHIGAGIFNISPRANHPARVAEKVATLDHLTNRRFEFGTGRGAGSHEVATFDIADKESTRAEYDEVIREIDRMWEQKDYTFHGEHFSMDVPHNVLPKPYGPGHRPFWLTVGSPPSRRKPGCSARERWVSRSRRSATSTRGSPTTRPVSANASSGRPVRERQRDGHERSQLRR